jgi:hypothetical protein
MKLTRTQIIGLITVAIVATTTIGILVVVDPFTPRYTLTIYDPGPIFGTYMANITVTPDGSLALVSPSTYTYKANTVVTLTIHVDGINMDFGGWTGPDATAVQVVAYPRTFTITMTKNMNITATWVV